MRSILLLLLLITELTMITAVNSNKIESDRCYLKSSSVSPASFKMLLRVPIFIFCKGRSHFLTSNNRGKAIAFFESSKRDRCYDKYFAELGV